MQPAPSALRLCLLLPSPLPVFFWPAPCPLLITPTICSSSSIPLPSHRLCFLFLLSHTKRWCGKADYLETTACFSFCRANASGLHILSSLFSLCCLMAMGCFLVSNTDFWLLPGPEKSLSFSWLKISLCCRSHGFSLTRACRLLCLIFHTDPQGKVWLRVCETSIKRGIHPEWLSMTYVQEDHSFIFDSVIRYKAHSSWLGNKMEMIMYSLYL